MKKMGIFVLSTLGLLAVIHWVIVGYTRRVLEERQLAFTDVKAIETLNDLMREESRPWLQDESMAPLPAASPFAEIDALDDEAHSWSTFSGVYAGAGVVVFDANGDGRLDLYLCHDGQNWARPTDEQGVLQNEPRYQSNTLYLNQGNDENGQPIFKNLAELAHRNDLHVEQELLPEDNLFPRRSASDSPKRAGRASNVALAADFNGDGRPDLLVGNAPPGVGWAHPETQRILPRFVSPMNREARHSKRPLASLTTYFLKGYKARQSIHDQRESHRGMEFEGANSLYLNLGDRDGDGLPEWQDASREVGLEGSRPSHGLAVADIDLDGDLDLFVANTMDVDYWPGGSRFWAGGANCLYVNQLAETGELRFIERAAEMDVDGVYDDHNPMPWFYRLRKIPFLPIEYSLLWLKLETYRPEYLSIDGLEAEHGQISWATVFQDVDNDGFPDLWVANDLGFLRLYMNRDGQRFEEAEHARSDRSGLWMSLLPADLNGDLSEDLVAGNGGGTMLNHAMVIPDALALFEPIMGESVTLNQFILGQHDTTHLLLDGRDRRRELPHRIHHSRYLPPDTSLPNNFRGEFFVKFNLPPFEVDTIDPYEFAWGMTSLDVQNDGRIDLYYLGCLYGRGGGIFPVLGTGPGRLFINATMPGGELRLSDQTAEHHLFNIEEVNYDRLESEGYFYRPAPRQNWRKRDTLYSYDRSVWVAQGPGILERLTNQDAIQVSENGRAAVAADLNGDGFQDLVVTNLGGYDSRSSDASLLKVMIDGRPRVLPPPDHNYPALTSFEPGRTRLFLNTYRSNNWIRVRLIDTSPGAFNRDAIGARVVVNGHYLQVRRAGDGGFIGNRLTDLHFGLGTESAIHLEITWPDRARTRTRHRVDSLARGLLVISKQDGVTRWEPHATNAS